MLAVLSFLKNSCNLSRNIFTVDHMLTLSRLEEIEDCFSCLDVRNKLTNATVLPLAMNGLTMFTV